MSFKRRRGGLRAALTSNERKRNNVLEEEELFGQNRAAYRATIDRNSSGPASCCTEYRRAVFVGGRWEIIRDANICSGQPLKGEGETPAAASEKDLRARACVCV